jgi:hypothetical protein
MAANYKILGAIAHRLQAHIVQVDTDGEYNTYTVDNTDGHFLVPGQLVTIPSGTIDPELAGDYIVITTPDISTFTTFTGTLTTITPPYTDTVSEDFTTNEAPLYTVPSGTSTVVSSISICNTGAGIETFKIRIQKAFSTNLFADKADYLYYDLPLKSGDTFIATIGATLSASDIIYVSSSSRQVQFMAFGSEIY